MLQDLIGILPIRLFLIFNFILYFVVHIPLDIKMRMSAKSQNHVCNNYLINTSVQEKLALFSISMWLIWFSFCFETLPNLISELPYFIIYLNEIYIIFGMVVMQIAVLLAIWTRLVRGSQSPAWGIYEGMKLIQNGPYKYLRHPSYVFYFLVLISLPLITGFLPSLLNLYGIRYYIFHVKIEENMMLEYYGEEYRKYQSMVGKFFPKIL